MSRPSNPVADAAVHNLASHQPNLSLFASLCLALLVVGLFTQSARAVVPLAGRYLYVVDLAPGLVEGFSVNRSTGALKTLGACAVVPAGAKPVSEAVDPTGSYLYVSDAVGNMIFGYTIAPLTGCLAPIPGSPWPTIGTGPMSAHVTEDAKFLYVSDLHAGAASVEGFQILGGGTLVPVPAPNPLAYGGVPAGLAFDSVGPYLFAPDASAPVGPITALQYNPFAGGMLLFAPGCPGPCATVTPTPTKISVSAHGEFLLVLSAGGVTLDSYSISRLTGGLGAPFSLPIPPGPEDVFADPFGRFGYVTNSATTTVQPYSITPAGVVAPIPPAVPLPAGSAPGALRVDQTGKFLYIALPGTSQIAGYTINATTGKLVLIAGSPWATFVPAAAPSSVHAITP